MKTKDIKQVFSTNLRNRLYAKNISQADLSRAVGASQTSVSHWINGEILPRPNMIDKIARFLVCSSDDLLTDHTKVVELSPEDVLAEELRENSRLFRLMFYAAKLSDDELDDLIEQVKR